MNSTYPFIARCRFLDGSERELRCAYARNFFERFMGLMGKDAIPVDCGLVFERCRSIHMLFMRVPIDVLWVAPRLRDGVYHVSGLSRRVRPWTIANAPMGASVAIEFPAGTFEEPPISIAIYDRVVVDEGAGVA